MKIIGTEQSIPALAALLTDAETAHAARIALESMPYAAATTALREAAGKATGLTQSGIFDSLGMRRDPQSVQLLAAALADKELPVVAAAALALGRIGNAEAAEALRAGLAKAQGDARTKIADGLVLCGDGLRAAGQNEAAAKIYSDMAEKNMPKIVRMAAFRGQMQMVGPNAAQAIATAMAGDDLLLRSAAAGELRRLSDADLAEIAAGMAKLPPIGQAAVIAAARIRAQKSLAPVIIAAAKSPDANVRLAVARALGIVGDLNALPALTELAEDEKAGAAARESLQAISGPKIDEKIMAALKAETDAERRAGWIGVVEARRPADAVTVLLAEAREQGPVVSNRAMAALAKLAGQQEIPAMVALVLKAPKGSQREDAERAVRAVCMRDTDAQRRVQPLLAILRKSPAAEQAELMPLLGRLGGEAVRPVVAEALKSTDPVQLDAGVRALANWPDASVATELLNLAKNAKSPEHRLIALRAYTRVAPLPGPTPALEKLAMLVQAMKLADRDEDRNYVLQRAGAVRTVETLRFVLPYLDQPALAQQTAKTVAELSHHKELRNPNLAEFKPAMEKVLTISTDATTLERVRRYLQGN